jgi:hypothetical protein
MSTPSRKKRRRSHRAAAEFLATKLRLLDGAMFDRIATMPMFYLGNVDLSQWARDLEVPVTQLHSQGFIHAVRRLAGTTAEMAGVDAQQKQFWWQDETSKFVDIKNRDFSQAEARVANYVGQQPNKNFVSKQQAMKRYRK